MVHSTALGEMCDNLFVNNVLTMLQTPLNRQRTGLFNNDMNYELIKKT